MTTLESLAAVAQSVLATTFILSAVAKMRTWTTLSGAIRRMTLYRLGDGPARLAATLLPWIELGLGVGLIAGFKLNAMATATTALLLTFTVFIVIHLVRESHMPCHCFGNDRAAISLGTLMRNVTLIVLAAGLAILARAEPAIALTPEKVLMLPWHELLGVIVTTISLMVIFLALSESSALSDLTAYDAPSTQ